MKKTENAENTENTKDVEPEKLGKKKLNTRFIILFAVLVSAGTIYGTIKYVHSQKHEETDDAQIEALISPVIPHVSGFINKVYVADNQFVKKGDTLLTLDNRDFNIQLHQAEACLTSARSNAAIAQAGIPVTKANVVTSEANVETVEAQIQAAEVNVWRANQDFKRYENLIKDHSITQQQFEQALAAKQTAERTLKVLETQRQSAARQTAAISSQKAVNAGNVSSAKALILKEEAAVDAANLQLSYTVITAQEEGQVSTVNLQKGQFVQAGQSLFSIVPSASKWVVANFKETQLDKIEIGQKVVVKVDAFPDHKVEGIVSSFSPTTGAKQSLLPPDNSSGNFVKTVQRLPVKIKFNHPEDEFIKKLRAGMNVLVDIHLDSNKEKG